MTRTWAEITVALSAGYTSAGLAVGVAFLLREIERAVPAARGSYAVRPLLLPGLVLAWPLVLTRWVKGHGAEQRKDGTAA